MINKETNLKEKNTVVISLFPGCGKQKAIKKFGDTLDMVSMFVPLYVYSGEKDSNGKKLLIKNTEFGAMTVRAVKRKIGNVDYIFVGSELRTRKALQEENIPFIYMIPSKDQLVEWVGRLYMEGRKANIIDPLIKNWDTWLSAVESEEETLTNMSVCRLNYNEYLSDMLKMWSSK